MPYKTYYKILVSIRSLLDDSSCQDFDSMITIRSHNKDAKNDNRSNRTIESQIYATKFSRNLKVLLMTEI